MLRVGFVLVLAICIFHASASERSLVSSFNKDAEHSIMLNLALTHREYFSEALKQGVIDGDG